MTRWLPIALIALLGFPADAQGLLCRDRAGMIAGLTEIYGEARRSLGVSGQSVVEVWVSSELRTFTILQTMPSGVTCIIAAGEGWQDEPPALPGKDS